MQGFYRGLQNTGKGVMTALRLVKLEWLDLVLWLPKMLALIFFSQGG